MEAKLPSIVTLNLLKKLQNEGLIYLKGDIIEVDSQNRLKLAVKAVELGADVECISNCLLWQEFEAMAALALQLNGYQTLKNVRFKHAGRRWEIDVVGCRKPHVVCIDCKHWHHGMQFSRLKTVVESQTARVAAFADSLPNPSLNLHCVSWEKAKFLPVILSLVPFRSKFCNEVPAVPVLQLQDFISQLPLQVQSLRCFDRTFNRL